MSLNVVQHNAEAMFTNRQLNIITGLKGKSSEKLASGYRINRAADDAAGLTISEKLRWQVRGLDKASTNIQDGISFLQTGEGALNEVHDMLGRIKELSIQAANDTNTDTDRKAIDEEVQQIKKEMNRIFNDTEFNTIKIFRAPYVPDIEGSPSDYKLFNLGNSDTVGGVMINNKRYTWDELGISSWATPSDVDRTITLNDATTDKYGASASEKITLKLNAGDTLPDVRRVYEVDADDTGIKINNLYAGKWGVDIAGGGDQYSFSYRGMDITVNAEVGDTLADVITHLQPDGMTTISWAAIPAGKSYSGAVSSTADASMKFNVTNTNKNNIENKSYSVTAGEDGVWVSEKNGAVINDGTKVAWADFDDLNGDYNMRDWGTTNEGANPVTLDDSAKYHFDDATHWDGITSDNLAFDFNYLKDEVSKAEAIVGLTQDLTAAPVSAPIQSVTDDSVNVTVTGYNNINFHFQRDQLLRDFGTNGSDAPMNGTVERTRVVDGTVVKYEERKQLSAVYVKNTTTESTTVTDTYGSHTRKYYLGDEEITADTDAALFAALEVEAASISAHADGEEISSTNSAVSNVSYMVHTGQSPEVVADVVTSVAGAQVTEEGTITYGTGTYRVVDTYDTTTTTTVRTNNRFADKNYYKNGANYEELTDEELYVEDDDTSNENRSATGMRYRDASSSDTGARYVEVGSAYVEDKRYDLCHYEYKFKNSSSNTVMTGTSGRFLDTSNGIVDSELDAGNWTTALAAENVEGTISVTNADGSVSDYYTNLNSRSVQLSGKNVDGATTTIDLSYNDKPDTSGTANASIGLTITPNGNATRTYSKDAQVAGSASKTGLKVKINPPEKVLNIQAGALGHQGIEIKWSALSNSIIGMGSVKTTSAGLAQAAICATDEAIDMISTVRSGFGAQQNRLEHAYAIDRIIQENTDAAESRIRDTNMAKETVIYSKYRLLEQVGQTLLAQANQNKMGILSLLQ